MRPTRNIRLKLAYDGTNYVGWQVQKNGLSIQEVLERAIEKLTGEKCPVLSAGRTDSGVHALGQVANFHTHSAIPAKNFRPALQDFLPRDVVILDSCEVPPEFHATFKATRKQYRYVIDNSPVPLPFLSKYTWSLRRRLDVPAMNDAARLLLGKHDFRSFETDWPNKVTSVRTVFEIKVARQPIWNLFAGRLPNTEAVAPPTSLPLNKGGQGGPGDAVQRPYSTPQEATHGESPLVQEPGSAPTSPPLHKGGEGGVAPDARLTPDARGDIICMDIIADGFLYNMVRSIMGTLVNVGRHKWDKAEVARILEARNRSIAGSTAPACGLFLVEVWYE
ncbi:MAG: tRNA pseudouridine(38-40) synthase TruA [Deltaproteobacteria bacterium]